MRPDNVKTSVQKFLLASLLASSFVCGAETADSKVADVPVPLPTSKPEPTVTKKVSAATAAKNWAAREGEYYKRNWGIEVVGVRQLSSGYMLEFRYRVINPEKANALIDKKLRPLLHDAASNVTLSVPTLDKVGAVRQSTLQEADRSYYIIFGNPGKVVKKGNRVSVTIGKFRAENIVVQ